MSRIGVWVLRRLSRPVQAADYVNEEYEERHVDVEAMKGSLRQTFPGATFRGRVLDIGCSEGMEAVAIAQLGAAEVQGIDIRIDPGAAVKLASRLAPRARVEFACMPVERLRFDAEYFDAIVTLGSLEHFADPFVALEECSRVLAPGGRLFLTSGVWRGPWGPHMQHFTRVPWVHFLFSESTIMEARSAYRSDGARRFAEVEGGLNRIGVRSFLQWVARSDLALEWIQRNPIYGQRWLAGLPLVGEFFTHTFFAVLRKRGAPRPVHGSPATSSRVVERKEEAFVSRR